MRCPACQDLLPTDAHFCPACGVELKRVESGPTHRLDLVQPLSFQNALPEGVCPKCASTEIYVDDRGLIGAGTSCAAVLNLHDWFGQKATIYTYICIACGYIELYLADASQVARIQKTWRRVEAR